MLGKKRKIGKKIQEINIGDHYVTRRKIEDKELLLYLGLTDDANPLYIQHDYASQTPYKQPIVPSAMLFGMVSAIISMHLPGPGSHIIKHEIIFPKPIYHESNVELKLEVTEVNLKEQYVIISAIGHNDHNVKVIHGTLHVRPAYELKSITANSLENFF